MDEQSNEPRVNLDEILKSLFSVSKKVLIQMMNSLFNENHDIEKTKVTFDNNEFVTDEYDIIRGDLFLSLKEQDDAIHYHIELQTKNDTSMVLRMFEYGYNKAKEFSRYNDDDEIIICIPKQLVIFIEQNSNIKDCLRMKLIFPDNQKVNYTVPVMKYWEYDDKKIIQNKMYPLLPLQVFKLRYRMDILKKKNNNSDELQQTVLQAKHIAETIAKEGKSLYDNKEINGDDLHKILLAVGNLFEYLNKKYGTDKKLEQEVFIMTRTLYDPTVEEKGIETGIKKGIIKVAKKMIDKDMDTDLIMQLTGLDMDTINKLKKNKSL